MSLCIQAGFCQESDPFRGSSQQAVGCADALGATAALLGALDTKPQGTAQLIVLE